jgi:YHS domain-containing protein
VYYCRRGWSDGPELCVGGEQRRFVEEVYARDQTEEEVNQEMTAIDPICKMEVDEKTAKWKSTYKGNNYYFCAPGCKKKFDSDPEKYLK